VGRLIVGTVAIARGALEVSVAVTQFRDRLTRFKEIVESPGGEGVVVDVLERVEGVTQLVGDRRRRRFTRSPDDL
jgi:hypothetical protein